MVEKDHGVHRIDAMLRNAVDTFEAQGERN